MTPVRGAPRAAYDEQRRRAGLPPTELTFDEPCYSPELVCASGVACVDLRTGRPSARAVLHAWREVSTDASYRENAERIGALLREHDRPREVVEHTMALLGAKPDAA